jgi:hypothetical protein
MLLYDPDAPDEGWWGGWIRTVFNVSRGQPFITLPREVARIILMDVCKMPVKVQNGFYEFLDYGRGLQPKDCLGGTSSTCNTLLQAYDRESVPTLGTFTGPAHVRIYPADPGDVGSTVIVQGTDQNGTTILSTDALTGGPVLGESISLVVPFATTINQFSTITGIQKDSTNGPVSFFQVNPVTLVQSSLSTMEPSETAANYRRYYVNGLPANCCNASGGVLQVTAMAKLDFVPVTADPDYLLIPNIPALIRQCESIRFGKMESKTSVAMSQVKHKEALALLFGQIDHMLGKERPAITVPLWGSQRLRPQPI